VKRKAVLRGCWSVSPRLAKKMVADSVWLERSSPKVPAGAERIHFYRRVNNPGPEDVGFHFEVND
jgi:hypothetical protein